MNDFILYCKQKSLGNIIEYHSFKKMTSLKMGGTARIYFEPTNIKTLQLALKYIYENKLNYFIIGNGTNLLVNDIYFDFIVINLKRFKKFYQLTSNTFYVEAGINSITFAKKVATLGYTGCEFMSVIPGNIGGNTWGNAGAYKRCMQDILIGINYLDEEGFLHYMDCTKNQTLFSYRKSPFYQTKFIIVSVIIKLTTTTTNIPLSKINEYQERKKATQPINNKSAGSTFKNNTIPSWQIIDKLGYRGYMIGDACVSEKHANFLINQNNALFEDMYLLIKLIQNDAYKKYKIILECEWVIVK